MHNNAIPDHTTCLACRLLEQKVDQLAEMMAELTRKLQAMEGPRPA